MRTRICRVLDFIRYVLVVLLAGVIAYDMCDAIVSTQYVIIKTLMVVICSIIEVYTCWDLGNDWSEEEA